LVSGECVGSRFLLCAVAMPRGVGFTSRSIPGHVAVTV
jgi:hypothetical protein